MSTAFLKAQIIGPPSDLEAKPVDTSYIEIKWHDNSSNEEGFFIERAEIINSSNWEIIGLVPQNVKQYYDYWATRGRKYYYRAYAYIGTIKSEYSNIDSAIFGGNSGLIPAAPSDLIVQNITSTSITINWLDNATNENGFIIARKGQNDLYFRYIDTVGLDILTYQEVGLTPDNLYQYKVCAFNISGISDYSNTVSGRTDRTKNISAQAPKKRFSHTNFPNPFNPSTNIKFEILNDSYVNVSVYNSLGKEVDKLLSQNIKAGTYWVVWDGQGHASGTYFYKISVTGSSQNEQFTELKSMVLIK